MESANPSSTKGKHTSSASSDKGKFGGLFGKSSSNSPVLTSKATTLARRSFFGRNSTTSASK